MAKIFEKLKVQVRYKITNDRIIENEANYQPKRPKDSNAIACDIVSEKAGYIGIKQMITPDLEMVSFKRESEDISNYLEKIKASPVLIIDIRQNSGCNSGHWSDFLMPLIIDKRYSQKTYSFIKYGLLFIKARKQSGFKEYTNKIKSEFEFLEEIFNSINDFPCFASRTVKFVPHKDTINFKGKIYLLVDKLWKFLKEKDFKILMINLLKLSY